MLHLCQKDFINIYGDFHEAQAVMPTGKRASDMPLRPQTSAKNKRPPGPCSSREKRFACYTVSAR